MKLNFHAHYRPSHDVVFSTLSRGAFGTIITMVGVITEVFGQKKLQKEACFKPSGQIHGH